MLRQIARIPICMLILAAAPAAAQDSVSTTPCLPGDAVSPFADGASPGGSEQINAYVVDMDTFQSSWGNSFAIAPIAKSSKTSAGFFGSLTSGQSMSRMQMIGVPFASESYSLWTDAGFGVNNDAGINTPGSLISADGLLGNQFAAAFAEFSTTDAGEDYNAVVGAVVNVEPANPTRLYVTRTMAATNSPDGTCELAQMGFGSVDAAGNVHFRVDDFGPSNGCGLNAISGNNIFRVNLLNRDGDAVNVISDDFPGGEFDAGATDWLIRNSATTYNTPSIMSSLVTGGAPLLLGTNFDTEYVRGPAFGSITEDMSHLPASASDHRGNLAYSPHNFVGLSSTHGMGAIIALDGNFDATKVAVFGLDAAGDVTGIADLTLPASIVDNSTGYDTAIAGPGTREFTLYQSQAAFRGGNGPVAIGVDQAGRLLMAGVVDNPENFGSSNWLNQVLAVARVDVDGSTDWTLAAYQDIFTLMDKPILDGPGGNEIGRLATLQEVTGGFPQGPSMSAPMIDSVGNIYFLSAIELFDAVGPFNNGLIRAVYDPDSFSYELELLLKLGDSYHGNNSNRDYAIDFLEIADSNSGSSGAPFSQNISAMAHLGMDPSQLAPVDTRTLGGLVIGASIVYDYDQNGEFDECDGPFGDDDQEYNVLLYISSPEAVVEKCPDLTLVDAAPAAGTVDARQPSNLDGTELQGIGSADEPVTLTFDSAPSADATCYAVCDTADNSNGIASVQVNGNSASIVLDHPLPANSVMTITAGGNTVEYTSHPANANADAVAGATDVLFLINVINGTDVSPHGTYSEDIDHSGITGGPDVLRLIDLLNGAGVYPVQNLTPLPVNLGDCP